MARITANGTPVKYPELGDIRVLIVGDKTDIQEASFQSNKNGKWADDPEVESLFKEDIKRGPTYPLCADPYSMRCALFVLYEWFGEAESCWIEEPKRVKLEGSVEPMENIPGVIY